MMRKGLKKSWSVTFPMRPRSSGCEKRRKGRRLAVQLGNRELLSTPRKVTASVWACFRLLAGREGDDDAVVGPAEASLRCLFCTSVIHTGGNSSNCLRHMRSDKHKEAWALVETAGRDGGVLNAVKAVKTILAAQTKRKENFFKVRSSRDEVRDEVGRVQTPSNSSISSNLAVQPRLVAFDTN